MRQKRVLAVLMALSMVLTGFGAVPVAARAEESAADPNEILVSGEATYFDEGVTADESPAFSKATAAPDVGEPEQLDNAPAAEPDAAAESDETKSALPSDNEDVPNEGETYDEGTMAGDDTSTGPMMDPVTAEAAAADPDESPVGGEAGYLGEIAAYDEDTAAEEVTTISDAGEAEQQNAAPGAEPDAAAIPVDEMHFPDANFRAYVSTKFDSDSDGYLSEEEIAAVKTVSCYNSGIASLQGIEYFSAMTTLQCSNNQLTTLDVSSNLALKSLSCSDNALTELNISTNTALTYLQCGKNQLTTLDVSANTALQFLNCSNNALTELDLEANTALAYSLNCSNNALTTLNVSTLTLLQFLNCSNNALTTLNVSTLTSLRSLSYSNNALTTLDVSALTALQSLDVSENELTALNVTHNTDLQDLRCYGNRLQELDISQCPTLIAGVFEGTRREEKENTVVYLNEDGDYVLFVDAAVTLITGTPAIDEAYFPDANFRAWVREHCDTDGNGFLSKEEITAVTEIICSGCEISSLQGIEYFPSLTILDCSNNQLKGLDLRHNVTIERLSCQGNGLSSLNISTCPALVSAVTVGTRTEGDYVLYQSENLMYALSVDASVVVLTTVPTGIVVDASTFPDAGFRAWVTDNCDSDGDGYLSGREISAVQRIDCSGRGIASLQGIEYFTSLTYLYCYRNNLTELDLSQNSRLTTLHCYNNNLTALNLSALTALTKLYCSENQLTTLDVSSNMVLTTLDCSGNQLTTLDVSPNTALTELYCSGNQLTTLDVSSNTALTELDCSGNQLTTLDVSSNMALTELDCSGNQVTTLDVSSNAALTKLGCSNNQLTTLNVSSNPLLSWLGCNNNELTTLNVSSNPALEQLYCSNNQLTMLDVSGNAALKNLLCDGNRLTSLNVSFNPLLTTLSCKENSLVDLDLTGCSALMRVNCYNNDLTLLDISTCPALITAVVAGDKTTLGPLVEYASKDRTASLSVTFNVVLITETPAGLAINAAHFPDVNFRTWLREKSDTDGNGYLSDEELSAVTEIICPDREIASLQGIDYFSALQRLICYSNELTELDVSRNTALTVLDCSNNPLTDLQVAGCATLTRINCSYGSLTVLDASDCSALTVLYCQRNNLTALNLSGCAALAELYCYDNSLTSLDICACPKLTYAVAEGTKSITGESVRYDSKSPLAILAADNATELIVPSGVFVSAARFPDANFRAWVSKNCDTDSDGFLSDRELAAVTTINCFGCEIASLQGIEYFSALTTLDCSNNALMVLPLSSNPALESLKCSGNNLITLNLSAQKALTELDCSYNQLMALDLRANTLLETVDCHDNSLTSLVLTGCTVLTGLDCSYNQLTALTLDTNTALESLSCNNNRLAALDVSANTALTDLNCYGNALTALDVRALTSLGKLSCGANRLTCLDVSANPALGELFCAGTMLTELDISHNTQLYRLACQDNALTTLDISRCPSLIMAVKEGWKAETDQTVSYDLQRSYFYLMIDRAVELKMAEPSYVMSFNATLSGELYLNAYIVISEEVLSDPNAYVTMSYIDASNRSNPVTVTKEIPVASAPTSERNGITRRVFTWKFFIAQVHDEITIQLHAGDGTVLPLNRQVDGTMVDVTSGVVSTPWEYLEGRIAKSTDPKMAALAQAIEYYGTAAQVYFNYNTGAIPSTARTALSAAVNDGGVVSGLKAHEAVVTGTLPTGISRYTSSLVVEADHSLVYHFYLASGVPISRYTFRIDGTVMTPEQEGDGKYCIQVRGIPSGQLSKKHTFSVTDGTNTCTITASALSYAYGRVLNSTNPNMVVMAKALYLYSKAADAYFGTGN